MNTFRIAMLYILSASAFAQELTKATDSGPTNWTPILIFAGIGVAVGVFFIWHRKNPAAADAALHAATASALDLAHKAADTAASAVQTVKEQAAVIGSAPVQAAINAGAPPPANNAPPPAAAIATSPTAGPAGGMMPPVPVTAAAPATPPPYPPRGMPPDQIFYRVENGVAIPDPLGMYRNYQIDAVKAQQNQAATMMATGPFPLSSLTTADCAYLHASEAEMTFDPRAMAQGNFYGEVSSLLGKDTYPEMGEARFNYLAFEGSKVNPEVVAAVRDMARGVSTPWMLRAFPSLSNEQWAAIALAGWSSGWKRLHPGQEP